MEPLLDVPSFLIQPDEPREIGYVEPTLRFACGLARYHGILEIIEEVWWEVRYHRAAAWDQDFVEVMKSEVRMRALADKLVAHLAKSWAWRKRTPVPGWRRFGAIQISASRQRLRPTTTVWGGFRWNRNTKAAPS